MISGDRRILQGEGGPFLQTLDALRQHWEHIDVIVPKPVTLAPTYRCEDTSHSIFPNVTFHPSPWSYAWQARWIRRRGRELIREHAYACITVQAYFPPLLSWGAQWLGRTSRTPLVAEIHGDPCSLVRQVPGVRAITRWLMTRHLRSYACVRVVSEHLRQTMEHWGVPPARLSVVPAIYLDLEIFRPQPNAAVRYDACFCGRLVAGKGLETTLEALAQLPGATLLVIGDGPRRAWAMQRASEPDLVGRVTFAGWVSEPRDLASHLCQARCLVVASAHEGGPRVAFEALACGVPVVSTRVGRLAEVMIDEQSGLWFDGSPAHLATQLKRLQEDEDLRAHLITAGQQITRTLERQQAIARYAQFLQAACASS